MGFQVARATGVMVRPAEPTPSENLELSAIDRMPGLRAMVRTLHVFEHGRDAGRVIREALGKALVCYYPFAGRLTESSGNGKVHVACTGEGVWFVEASANCGLKEICGREIDSYAGDLLPVPAAGDEPDRIIMLMQVTQFDCGGFILGLKNSHCISDGLGTAQFLTALAELARGLSSPSITPIWCPAAIPSPPTRPFHIPPFPPPPTLNLRRATIDLSLNTIPAFKSRFLSSTGHPCSAFEAIAAILWQSRARAVLKNAQQSPQFHLVFMANARPLIRPPLPPGFCSNCFFPVNISAAGSWLTSATTVEVVQLIKEAKGRLPDEFRRWEAGEGKDPYLPALGYGTLFLLEWSKLGFEKVDYGWGTPKEVVPLMYSDLNPVVIVGLPPSPATGIRLSTQCVEEEHERDFVEGMRRAWDLGEWLQK